MLIVFLFMHRLLKYNFDILLISAIVNNENGDVDYFFYY